MYKNLTSWWCNMRHIFNNSIFCVLSLICCNFVFVTFQNTACQALTRQWIQSAISMHHRTTGEWPLSSAINCRSLHEGARVNTHWKYLSSSLCTETVARVSFVTMRTHTQSPSRLNCNSLGMVFYNAEACASHLIFTLPSGLHMWMMHYSRM